MRRALIGTLSVSAVLGVGGCPPTAPYTDGVPLVTLETARGEITIETDPENAPRSTENFVQYAQEGFYSGTLVHRVVPGFVIQAGGFTPGLVEKPATRNPIISEATNGLPNLELTVGMARLDDPNSATTQFYINLEDNVALDASLTRPGYAVFGRVIEGADVVTSIAAAPTATRGDFSGVPTEDILIFNVRVETGPDRLSPEWQAYVDSLEQRAFLSLRDIILTLIQAQIIR